MSQPPGGPEWSGAAEPGDGLRARGEATGELLLELQGPVRMPIISSPQLSIDGYPVPAHWGENRVRVPVGTRAVTICTRNALSVLQPTFGRADITVQVGANQQLPVHYSTPYLAFQAGAIGSTPQGRPGRTGFLLIVLLPGAIGLLIGLIAVLVALLGGR